MRHWKRIVDTKELVRAAYVALLGREPESEEVLTAKAAALQDPVDILQHFLSSEEFQASHKDFIATLRIGQAAIAQDVAVDATENELRALFDRICRQWQKLGDIEPYWSVLTNDRYRLSKFQENKAEFERTGEQSLQMLQRAAARCHTTVPTGVCLELGSGVGRVTRHLADQFEKVIGVDVSEGNSALCKKYLLESGKHNVDVRVIKAPVEIEALPEYDMFYSIIVLQHNPPPVIRYFLTTLLSKIRPGGAAYFQVPTHTPNYKFSIGSYLKSATEVLDMHLLPMPHVLRCIDDAGLKLREVLMDTSTGMYGSHSFYAVKPL
ncbi:MAG: class I SAM-dependent methyltransferase [Hyphomicrobium sp.]|nr:MAG: class I SAM-dependent methyltransferase [Hyphomicrobium sp.]